MKLPVNTILLKEFKAALEDENTVILDARNDYEYDLGHFRGAIRPDITRFRDLPEWVRNNKNNSTEKYCHILYRWHSL